ncbi:MAG: two-component system sensor histidine kinase TorS [Gammaproteobacteria bacterium]|jgi:two-component system sensor histidine kinase TorS
MYNKNIVRLQFSTARCSILRMHRLGIAAKLYLAFGSIFLLAVVASSVGWKGFLQIAESQNSVIDQAIPGLRQAHRLSALNASIGAAAQQLLRANNELERIEISSELFSQVNLVHALLDDFQQKEFSVGSLKSLRETVRKIERKLHQQDELVRKRNHQQAHFNQLASGLITATDELNELADSLVANAAATSTAITSSLYDLVKNNASKQQLYKVFDRIVEVDLDAMERMYELRLRSSILTGLFNQVAKESDLAALNFLRQRTSETLSILKRRVSEINDPKRRENAAQLLNLMEVDNGPLYIYGIFESRISLMEINQALSTLSVETGEASRALNGIVNELNATGGALINQVSTTAKQSLDTSRRWFGFISVILLIVAAAILWGFIKRNVIRRLLSLESATRAITDGNYNVHIIVEGHDELTAMGKALRGFRNNAIDNRKLDNELRKHKAHLEELVEERSEQLRETNEMLLEEAQNHALAREKAEQANQAKTAFLATMSHELRTPLSGALGTLRLLSDTPLQTHQSDYVHIINAANTTLLDIVNDILGYSQLEAGKLKIVNRPFDLSELLDNVIGIMRVSVREKHNSLQLVMNDALSHWLMGDSGKLHQILINLIGNANKFTDNGSITLQVSSLLSEANNNVSLHFSVEDSGIGIAKNKQAEIFQAFTQVDTSSARRYGGIGLGLAICDRLVDAMGGKISLDSELGTGTTIGFNLEIALCDSVPITQQPAVLPLTVVNGIDVLMVEDDAINSMVTSNYLEHLGYRVTAAQTGEEALKFLNVVKPSLVLLDISLPGIDGLTILKHIRANADSLISNMPVIAMSAHVFTEEVDRYLKAGMNDFLGKPFSIENLEHAIAKVSSGGSSNDVTIANARDSKSKPQLNPKTFEPSVVDGDIDRIGLDQVVKIVDLYFKTSHRRKDELLEAIAQEDFDRVKTAAHQLNGSASNFGFEHLCAILSELEVVAIDGKEIPATLAIQFEKAFSGATAALNLYMAGQVTPRSQVQSFS